MARSWVVAAVAGAGASLGACGGPTDPCFFIEPPSGTHQARVDAVVGQGIGGVSATSIPEADGTFHVLIRFRVKCGASGTTYTAQRASEGSSGKPLSSDGVCQRAQGQSPWTAADGPAFVAFPRQDGGTGPVTMTTSSTGEGSLDFDFRTPALHRGDRFDVEMRLVDNEASPTSDLRSGCMTIAVN
ncbi:MAG: hypothetical protein ABIS21_05520 [Acidimicrobiales bacterium]